MHPRSILLLFCFVAGVNSAAGKDLTLADLFPRDRVLDVRITLAKKDWDKIRIQTRSFQAALSPRRQFEPPKTPYTYVTGKAVIDGVVFPKVGIRKKGFIGSRSSSRPSLKIKLNHVDKGGGIDGLKNLTFNNNLQDVSQLSQFMGYALFNQIGSPAPRCAYAKITVNDVNMGIYTHVESVRKPLLKRGFGSSKGTLYEGTVTDFFAGWEASFERKFGKKKRGMKHIKKMVKALMSRNGKSILDAKAKGRAWVPTDGQSESQWSTLEFDDSSWVAGRNGAGFDSGKDFKPLISSTFDFGDKLHNKSSSLYLRFPFQMSDSGRIDSSRRLVLRMKYDDGFVAYLNGHKVVSVNAPKTPTWKSNATAAHDDRAAMRFESFDISVHKNKLRKGKNVLAIHGMNINAESTDMLFVAEIRTSEVNTEQLIGKYVDLDSFYKFWAMEGLLGFWDGYSGNRNNFFIYLNTRTKKLHFIPWGADCMFEKFSQLRYDRNAPISVKTLGLICHKLYQTKTGRQRYAAALKLILKDVWKEEALLSEISRIEKLIKPHLCLSQRFFFKTSAIRGFVRVRRKEVMKEISQGMPLWNKPPSEPPVISGFGFGARRAEKSPRKSDKKKPRP